MSKSLIKKSTRSIQPTKNRITDQPLPFVSFSYSYREISSTDEGQVQVRAEEIRYEHGRLTQESFNGVTGAGDFFRLIADMQTQMMQQMLAFWRPFGLFAPPRAERED